MKIITQQKKKEKIKLEAFFNGFTETPTAPIKNIKKDSPLLSSAFVSAELADNLKNNEDIREIKSAKLHEILNRFIERGVFFDVAANDFLIIDAAQNLKLSDLEFLQINKAAILCQLQQSLLVKHLFSHSPEEFEDFAFEIYERESLISRNYLNSLLTITAETTFEIYFEAVREVTCKWFALLLDSMGEQTSKMN